jgi:hypothetical protein
VLLQAHPQRPRLLLLPPPHLPLSSPAWHQQSVAWALALALGLLRVSPDRCLVLLLLHRLLLHLHLLLRAQGVKGVAGCQCHRQTHRPAHLPCASAAAAAQTAVPLLLLLLPCPQCRLLVRQQRCQRQGPSLQQP